MGDWYPDWLVCQMCGRQCDPDGEQAEWWLVSESREVENLFVVRCPLHISDSALRRSKAGRTREMLELRRRGKEEFDKRFTTQVDYDLSPPGFIGADGREYIRQRDAGEIAG